MSDEQLSEADKLRASIAEKRELLADKKADVDAATRDAAEQHELALLKAEAARLDRELEGVQTPEQIIEANSRNLLVAEGAAALYESGAISGTAPIDVAAATAAAMAEAANAAEAAKEPPKGRMTAAEKREAAAAAEALRLQQEADQDSGQNTPPNAEKGSE